MSLKAYRASRLGSSHVGTVDWSRWSGYTRLIDLGTNSSRANSLDGVTVARGYNRVEDERWPVKCLMFVARPRRMCDGNHPAELQGMLVAGFVLHALCLVCVMWTMCSVR